MTPSYYIPKAIMPSQSTPIIGYYTSELIPILNPTATNSELECNQLLTQLEQLCNLKQRHEFKNYPFVDDKLKRLMRKVRTSLQLVVLNTPTTHVGVHVHQIRPQLNFFTNPILINQHLSWSQPIIYHC